MIGMYAFAYPNMIVEHYTAERGLPNNIVNCTLNIGVSQVQVSRLERRAVERLRELLT